MAMRAAHAPKRLVEETELQPASPSTHSVPSGQANELAAAASNAGEQASTAAERAKLFEAWAFACDGVAFEAELEQYVLKHATRAIAAAISVDGV